MLTGDLPMPEVDHHRVRREEPVGSQVHRVTQQLDGARHPPDVLRRLEHHRPNAQLRQQGRAREPRRTGTDHDDPPARYTPCSHDDATCAVSAISDGVGEVALEASLAESV